MKAFTGIPFFRIMIPFIAGILLGIKLTLPDVNIFFFVFLFGLLVLARNIKAFNHFNKWIFILLSDVFLFLFGLTLLQQKDLSKQAEYYGNQVNTDTAITFIASLNDLPVEKERFIKCDLKVLEIKKGKRFIQSHGTILGYFKRSPGMLDLKAGQTILVKASMVDLSPPKNPFEFDYRNYLFNKQIYHTAFIDPPAYAVLPVEDQLNPLWKLGLTCKHFLLTRLRESGLTQNAYAICAALLTGYDDEIDKPVMEAFSHSGTLHVLSVSGLHTGLIYLALNFIFNFFDRKKRYKLSRLIFITLFLWFFALITGFSAPVLRAVIMFNLLGFGKIYFRARFKHQLNILLVSAFVLLIYNPFYILDIGFLLSYFALFGLIYFQPAFTTLWQPENKFLQSTWQSVTASVAATISTLPITLFYFKQFPLWFFVCNIVVVPATFILLLLALFVVFKVNFVSLLINYLISFLIWFINLFNSKSIGFIDTIHFTFSDVLFLSLFIILISVSFQYRSFRQLALSLILLVAWQLVSLIQSYSVKSQSLLTVYNVKNKNIVSIKNKTQTLLTEVNSQAYNFNIKPHITSFNYAAQSSAKFNLVKAEREWILFLNKPGFYPDVNPGKIATLVLSNNFNLLKQDLKKYKNLKMVVLDASNNSFITARAEELCRNFGISFYNTKHEGAYLLALK